MCKDRGADGAGPHSEAGGQLAGHLRVAGQVLPEAALVDVELAAHRTRVVRAPTLGCTNVKVINVVFFKRLTLQNEDFLM